MAYTNIYFLDGTPEFVLVNKEPEPDPEDPSRLIYSEDPLILHTPTGKLINYVEDDEHGIRLFWQPELEEGEDVDPDKAVFLPLGFDEYYGKTVQPPKEGKAMKLFTAVENALNPLFEKMKNWVEEQRKVSELKLKLIEQEMEFIEAQICLEEEMEELDNELKKQQKEEEKKAEKDQTGGGDVSTSPSHMDTKVDEKQEEEDIEDDDGDDQDSPTSFGTVSERQGGQDSTKFSTCSLIFTSAVSSSRGFRQCSDILVNAPPMVKYPCFFSPCGIRAAKACPKRLSRENFSHLHGLAFVVATFNSCPKMNKKLSKKSFLSHLKAKEPLLDWNNLLSIQNFMS